MCFSAQKLERMLASAPIVAWIDITRSESGKGVVFWRRLLQRDCDRLGRSEYHMLLALLQVRQLGDVDRFPRHAEEVENTAELMLRARRAAIGQDKCHFSHGQFLLFSVPRRFRQVCERPPENAWRVRELQNSRRGSQAGSRK